MSELNYSLRQATPVDLEYIYELEKEAMKPHIVATWGDWDEAHFRNYFEEKQGFADFQLVLVDGENAGALYLIDKADEIVIQGIYVDAAFRNQGLGTQLLEDLITRSEQERKPLTLRVLRVSRALNLYKRVGFLVVDEDEEFFYMRRDPDDLTR